MCLPRSECGWIYAGTIKRRFLESPGSLFFPGIWGIILLSAKYFILSILYGSCSIMGYTLYWSFKQNTINRIWSFGWLTGIKKINFHKTIPRGLSEACQNASPPWTRAERLWLLCLLVSPLNEFVQPSLPSGCFPPFRSHISQEGASLSLTALSTLLWIS